MTSKRSLNEIFVVILRGKFREPEIGAREKEEEESKRERERKRIVKGWRTDGENAHGSL